MDEKIDRKKRNYGIDLLRIVSMIMIVTLHVMGHGGVLEASAQNPLNYALAWALEIAAYCAVNCYALVSGYVGYGTKFKYSNIVVLYLQVVFWILIVQLAFAFFVPGSVGLKDMIKAFLPFAVNTYWYFTAYFCMFFFIPFMNCMMDSLEKKQAQTLVVTIIAMFSLLPTAFQNDMFKMSNGSSVFWLSMLYIVGAYIRKYKEELPGKLKSYLILYLICIVVTWLSQYGIEKILGKTDYHSALVSYVSPTVLFAAIGLLLLFADISLGKWMKKIVSFFAPVSFGVYLVHEQPLIRQYFVTGKFVEFGAYSAVGLVVSVITTVCIIWLTGSLLDYVRLIVFKVFKVKELSFFVIEKLTRRFK